MKKLITLFILFSITSAAIAQDDTTKSKATKEWSLNATLLTSTMLRSNTVSRNATPNVISYKAIWQDGNAFRLGFGGFLNSGKGLFKEPSTNAHIHMGYEKQKQLSRNWVTFIGFEVPYNLNIGDAFSWDIGLGALWGIQWMIHPNVGIYTEGGLYYSRSFADDRFVDILHTVEFVIPRALYIGIRF